MRATSAGRINNNILELHTALVALAVACLLFPQAGLDGTLLLSVVDSSAALGALHHSSSCNAESNRLMRFSHLYAALSDFRFSLVDRPAVRVLSADMLFADPLSRRDWARFWSELDPYDPDHNFIRPIIVPPAILSLDSLDAILTITALDIPTSTATTHLSFWRDRLHPTVAA